MDHKNGSDSEDRVDNIMTLQDSLTEGQLSPDGLAHVLIFAALVTPAANGAKHLVDGLGGSGKAGLREIGAITERLNLEYCIVVHVLVLLVADYLITAELMRRNGGVHHGTGRGEVRLVAHVRVGGTWLAVVGLGERELGESCMSLLKTGYVAPDILGLFDGLAILVLLLTRLPKLDSTLSIVLGLT